MEKKLNSLEPVDASPAIKAKAYFQPQLHCYGEVRVLTAGGSGVSAETQSNQSLKRHT